MRILHVITALNTGGAEMMLLELVRASRGADQSHEVVSLMDVGPVGQRIAALGVPVHSVGMSRLPSATRMARLVRIVRRCRPDVVQTWMYHADLLGGVAARIAGVSKVVWGLHSGTFGVGWRRTTRWTVGLCARLSSRVPDVIVAVSAVGRDVHVAAGYDPRKFVVIPNGIDPERFKHDPVARARVRDELRIEEGQTLVGLVARFDPQKDHATFLRAAGIVARRRPEVRFLLAGDGTTPGNGTLAADVARAGLLDRVALLGRRDDVPSLLSALDVVTLSSAYGEAFPLSIAEGMASGVPAVVTDVGDCAHLVGDTGRVAPPRDPDALARAWEDLVRLGPEGRHRLGCAARERIVAHFSLPRAVEAYASLYRGVLAPALGGAGRSAPRPTPAAPT